MNTGAGMSEDPAEIGALSRPAPAAMAEKAARDAEFSIFYREDMPRLVGFLITQDAPPTLAADIAQEAMTAVYREWDVVESPKAWVRRVASRRWWRLAGRIRRELPADLLPESSGLLDESQAEEIQQRHVFLHLLRDLPPQQRTVLALTYDGYRPTEIAALLGMNPATVRSHLRAARARLKSGDEEAP